MSELNKAVREKTKSVREQNIKNYILYGMFLSVSMNLTIPFIEKMLYRLGGTADHIALYKMLPGIIAVFTTIPGIILINRAKNKKKTMIRFIFASRFMTGLIAVIPFLPVDIQPMALVILMSIRYLPESIGNAAVQSYTGDIFNGKDRATAISSKNMYSVFSRLGVSMVMFVLLRFLKDNNETMIPFYQVLAMIAFLISLFEIQSFNKLKEEEKHGEDSEACEVPPKFKLEINKDNKNFYMYALCSMLFHFGWQMGWPLFSIYQIEYLGANESWIIIFGVISSVVMFFGYKFWNKQIHDKGNAFVVAVATGGMAATPVLFALSPNLYVLSVVNVITGFFTAGTVTVLVSALLENVPKNNRIMYVGIHATLTSITLTFAPLVGKFFYEAYSIRTALVICGVFRLIGSIAFFIKNKLLK